MAVPSGPGPAPSVPSGLVEEVSRLSTKVSTIISTLSASVYGISLMDNPIGFVTAVLVREVSGFVIQLFGTVAQLMGLQYDLLADVLEDGGEAILSPFGIVGELFLGILGGLNSGVTTVAAAGGPFAPFATLLLWGLLVWLIGIGIQYGLNAVKWVS